MATEGAWGDDWVTREGDGDGEGDRGASALVTLVVGDTVEEEEVEVVRDLCAAEADGTWVDRWASLTCEVGLRGEGAETVTDGIAAAAASCSLRTLQTFTFGKGAAAFSRRGGVSMGTSDGDEEAAEGDALDESSFFGGTERSCTGDVAPERRREAVAEVAARVGVGAGRGAERDVGVGMAVGGVGEPSSGAEGMVFSAGRVVGANVGDGRASSAVAAAQLVLGVRAALAVAVVRCDDLVAVWELVPAADGAGMLATLGRDFLSFFSALIHPSVPAPSAGVPGAVVATLAGLTEPPARQLSDVLALEVDVEAEAREGW